MMGKRSLHIILLISGLLILPVWLMSQEPTANRSLETWFSGQFKYRLHRQWTVSLEQQLRLKSRQDLLDRVLTEAEIGYKLDENFQFALGVRYVGRNDDFGSEQGFENHIRFHGDATFQWEAERFEVEHRFRYQNRNQLGKTIEDGDYVAQDYRLKNSIGYNFRNWKLDPTIGWEWFFHREIGELNGFNRNRLFISTTYKLNKYQRLGFTLMRERETRVWQPRKTWVLMFKYRYFLK